MNESSGDTRGMTALHVAVMFGQLDAGACVSVCMCVCVRVLVWV